MDRCLELETRNSAPGSRIPIPPNPKNERRNAEQGNASSPGLNVLMDSGLVGRKVLVRSHEDKRCSILGPTQSRISPSIHMYTKPNMAPVSENKPDGVLESGAEVHLVRSTCHVISGPPSVLNTKPGAWNRGTRQHQGRICLTWLLSQREHTRWFPKLGARNRGTRQRQSA